MANHIALSVALDLEEDGEHTEARATLDLNGARFVGVGRAHRNPADPDVPVIGEELAAARALDDLSHRILADADETIHDVELHPSTGR